MWEKGLHHPLRLQKTIGHRNSDVSKSLALLNIRQGPRDLSPNRGQVVAQSFVNHPDSSRSRQRKH